MKYVRELLKGNTDSLLLTLISEKPVYGYQIIKELEKRSQGYFQPPSSASARGFSRREPSLPPSSSSSSW